MYFCLSWLGCVLSPIEIKFLHFIPMTSDKYDSINYGNVQLNEENYIYWSYVKRIFLKEKGYGVMLMEPL